MAGPFKHLRSSTANKRPTASGLAEGQLALNTASGTPALFFKDNAGTVVKVGPAHVGGTAPNTSPAGSAGNSRGELWVDTSSTIAGLNYYNGSAFVNLTPSGSATVPGLVELATNAETQTGTDAGRAVTPASLQSKLSDSTSTTSSTTIASATAVKAAYDLANAALPKSGGSVIGELLIAPSGSLVFEGSTDDGFETTLAVTNPTADRTITIPNTTGTIITTGDTGTVTSTMIANDTIVNADINASAAIADTKLATISTAGKVSNSATTATSSNTASAIVARDGSGNFTANVITASLTGNVTGNLTGTASAIADGTVTSAKIVDGAIVNADVNASAAIAGTKISPDFGSQNITTTGTATASGFIPTGSGVPTNGMYLPAANQLAFSTNGTGRLFINSSGNIGINTASPGVNLEIASTTPVIRFTETDSSGFGQIYVDGSVLSIDADPTAAIASSAIRFNVDNLERARIDSSGRLLVGTSSARGTFFNGSSDAQFQVEGGGGGAAFIRNLNDQFGAAVILAKTRGSANVVVQNNDELGYLSFQGNDGTDFPVAASISAAVDGTPGANDMPGRLVFSTTGDGASSPTERMRISQAGIINLNGQRADFPLPMSGSGNVRVAAASAGGISLSTFDIQDYTAAQFVREVSGTAQQVGTITCSSSATAYNTSSDYRLKENVVPLTGAADRLKLIPVHRFNFIADPDKTVDGFLAHEAQAVVPECVTGEKDAVDEQGNPIYQGIDQSKLVPLLTAALQETIAELQALKAEVSALKGV